MAINLVKGEKRSIEKGLSNLKVGLGWDPNEGTGIDFDLDASAFILGSNGKIPNDNYFVFYQSENRVLPNKMNELVPYDATKYPDFEEDYIKKTRGVSPDWAVFGALDDTTGGASDGGDVEDILVDLSKVSQEIKEIIFVVTIYEHDIRKQNFGQVSNSYIRIVNTETNEEIMKYELDEDYSTETSIEFGRLYRRGGEWKFEAMGRGYEKDLGYFVSKYN